MFVCRYGKCRQLIRYVAMYIVTRPALINPHHHQKSHERQTNKSNLNNKASAQRYQAKNINCNCFEAFDLLAIHLHKASQEKPFSNGCILFIYFKVRFICYNQERFKISYEHFLSSSFRHSTCYQHHYFHLNTDQLSLSSSSLQS